MSEFDRKRYVIVLVGLPGSGKTYLANKISRYLNWIGYKNKIFRTSTYRTKEYGELSCSFFDNQNDE